MRVDSRTISRRGFLVLTAGTAVAGLTACGSSPSGPTPVRIDPNSPQVAAAEKRRRGASAATTSMSLATAEGAVDLGAAQVITWTYGGELPGKEIRVKRGDVLKVDLSNTLSVPTTIHWHGIALRNDMDGVPDLTQSEIKAGGRFTYEFTVPDAGTYWFHPHVGTQLDTGLYAPLIVEDPDDGNDYDTELVVVLDDWLDGLGRSPDAVLADLRTNGMPMGHESMPGMSMPQSAAPPAVTATKRAIRLLTQDRQPARNCPMCTPDAATARPPRHRARPGRPSRAPVGSAPTLPTPRRHRADR